MLKNVSLYGRQRERERDRDRDRERQRETDRQTDRFIRTKAQANQKGNQSINIRLLKDGKTHLRTKVSEKSTKYKIYDRIPPQPEPIVDNKVE